ncbi:MAG: glycosyl hydrolase [Burkholderiales bacterium]|nr:glycosyl hydrolase [Burkholderiales bacterium]
MDTRRLPAVALLVLALFVLRPALAAPLVVAVHAHGLAFSANGRQLLIPTHRGLAVYAGGRWSMVGGPAHDFVSLAATRDALYSSGHPARGSGLADPMGLIKSTDGGRTWRRLGLHGETDFHTLAASRSGGALYVGNRQPNSKMESRGIHYSLDDGAHWERAEAQGLGGPIHQLAAHPLDPDMVAAASDAGIYLSRDRAATFTRLGNPGFVLAVSFDPYGEYLWFSGWAADKAWLMKLPLRGDRWPSDIVLPPLVDDAVSHIAHNPVRPTEVAIGTFKRNVFVSQDLGGNWLQVLTGGAVKE